MASAMRRSTPMLIVACLVALVPPPASGSDWRGGQARSLLREHLSEIDLSLSKCLALVNRARQDRALDQVVRKIARDAQQGQYSSPESLAAIKTALGQSIDLSEADLATCVRVANTVVVAGGLTVGCPAGSTLCSASGESLCCINGQQVCAQFCDDEGGACFPYCEPFVGCFPAEATVRLESGGVKPMQDLAIGDRVQVAGWDGSLRYEDVYMFTHRDRNQSGRAVELALASGHRLTLSPRHFVPVAPEGGAPWASRLVKAANEIAVGDGIWHVDAAGVMLVSSVTGVRSGVSIGAFNPLTLSGVIVVDGVVASAHSDWFLDGLASADSQARMYQALFAPMRGLYRAIGPRWMQEVTEGWGVVDFAREWTAPRPLALGMAAALLAAGLAAGLLAGLRRHRRRAARP
jgi:hypothetical protein